MSRREKKLKEALEFFIEVVNPPHPQSLAIWQEHLKAATEKAQKALQRRRPLPDAGPGEGPAANDPDNGTRKRRKNI